MAQPEYPQTSASTALPGEAAGFARAPVLAEFDALYEGHFDAVWRLLQAVGVARANLDDAVQDVFLTAFRQHGQFDCVLACLRDAPAFAPKRRG
jgi:hypothetical protein